MKELLNEIKETFLSGDYRQLPFPAVMIFHRLGPHHQLCERVPQTASFTGLDGHNSS